MNEAAQYDDAHPPLGEALHQASCGHGEENGDQRGAGGHQPQEEVGSAQTHGENAGEGANRPTQDPNPDGVQIQIAKVCLLQGQEAPAPEAAKEESQSVTQKANLSLQILNYLKSVLESVSRQTSKRARLYHKRYKEAISEGENRDD